MQEPTSYLCLPPETQRDTLSPDNFRFRTEYVCVSSETVGVEVSGSSGGDDELYHVHLDCETGSSLDCSTRGLSSAPQLTCALCTVMNRYILQHLYTPHQTGSVAKTLRLALFQVTPLIMFICRKLVHTIWSQMSDRCSGSNRILTCH